MLKPCLTDWAFGSKARFLRQVAVWSQNFHQLFDDAHHNSCFGKGPEKFQWKKLESSGWVAAGWSPKKILFKKIKNQKS